MTTKTCFYIVLCLAVAVTAGAHEFAVEGMPEAVFADSEIVTNVALRTHGELTRRFSFALEHTANPSNSLMVAFGRDTDGDGNLSEEETGMCAGWDSGEWVIESKRESGRFAWPVEVTNGTVGTLSFDLEVKGSDTPRKLTVRNGDSVLFDGRSGIPAWLCDVAWDTAKVTARGQGVTAERVAVEMFAPGFAIYLR